MANTVVVVAGKHAMTAMDLVQVIQHSDVPAGVINMLTAAEPRRRGKVLAEHEDVDAIWFFGAAEGSTDGRGSVHQQHEADLGFRAGTDRTGPVSLSEKLLLKSTQVKNIWVPYGV